MCLCMWRAQPHCRSPKLKRQKQNPICPLFPSHTEAPSDPAAAPPYVVLANRGRSPSTTTSRPARLLDTTRSRYPVKYKAPDQQDPEFETFVCGCAHHRQPETNIEQHRANLCVSHGAPSATTRGIDYRHCVDCRSTSACATFMPTGGIDRCRKPLN